MTQSGLSLQLLLLPHLQQLPVPSHRPKLRLELLEALPARYGRVILDPIIEELPPIPRDFAPQTFVNRARREIERAEK